MTSDDVFVFPLSFSQQSLWFVHQMEPAGVAYNMPLALRLSGPLHVQALQSALNEIVQRHEILRTTFDVLDQQPVQLVAAEGTLALAHTDLSSLPQSGRELEAERLAREEAQHPFDLVRGSLIRALLLRLANNEHVLLLTMHHIVSDGWSQTVLMNELGVLYEAAVAGDRSPLPELPIQYADFAEWQRAWLRGERLDQQLEYWRKQLAGAPPLLELPADRPRRVVQSFNGARESFVLSRESTSRLVELSRREDATLFMTLLAAFLVLLNRYTAESDIVVGTPVANRNRQELESLIGFFVNTLPLRADLSGDPPLRELLACVRNICLDAYAHQDVPFEMLVQELSPARDPGRNPIFQVMFALQNMPEAAAQPAALAITPVDVNTARAQFDLTLDVTQADGQLHAGLVYNTDLFDTTTIERMASHFQLLLAGIADNVDRPIGALPLLTATELRQLLVEWNDTAKELTTEVCIHRLFEQQAERSPEAIALAFEERQMTYDELNRRANKLAHYLRALGVGPESFTGFMLQRSPEMIVALLAILKTGGAYVPLDPASPPSRLAYIVDDARISILVTVRKLANRLPPAARIVYVDDEEIGHHADRNPRCWTSGRNAVYAIYTSGSTGTPKGTVIEHHSVCKRVADFVESFAVSRESCVLQFASLGFDASVEEIFTALITGARLCLVSRETMLSGRGLIEYARAQGVTVATLPPSLLAMLNPDDWPELETVVSVGERCPGEVAGRWSKGRRFINGYGPTEATIGSSLYHYDGSHADEPPIGRPLSNTQIYLLDQCLNPVPVGAAGELHIGGAGVARGYLGRPDLTAEKFIPDPFSPEPGARIYKTGDMARYLRDGNIKFLGRRDEQLKIRGLRIEPGEIEATLKDHAAVVDAVVIADQDQRLVAYVVPAPHAVVTGEELRAFTGERLPDYMVPSPVVLLAELPLTANGKVDRIALRARAAQLERVNERVGPRDLLESQLARIWEELLHVEPGVRDNFFELGGHSLLLVPLVSRVEELTGKKLDVAAIFTAPTIESLALLLRREVESGPLVAMQPRGSLPPVFFVHPAGGSVVGYFGLARALGDDRPFYALAGSLDRAPGTTIQAMAETYVEVVREIKPDGPYLLGGWSTGGVVAFEMARQLQSRGENVSLVALLDPVAPGGYEAFSAPADLYRADIEAVTNYDPSPAAIPLVLLSARDESHDPD
ncbi:MAG TPA: amino acid adenylation domain-containing protein, partial [Pyrinomonadaceae bacterium]|nr:amino acid adenylation domain-containing protein [Pyrinomonadaceae bacterium]